MKQKLHSYRIALLLVLVLAATAAKAQPFVEVLQPTTGDVWILNQQHLISWNTNFTQPVKIELIDYTIPASPVTTTIVASTQNSTYSWLITDATFTTGTAYKIKVSSTVNSSFADESETFTIAASAPGTYVTLEQPNTSGINWLTGGEYVISWVSDLTGTFKIDLLDYNNGGPIVTNIAMAASPSTYYWTIPGTVEDGTMYKIKVTSNSDPSKSYTSDQYFTITETPAGATVEVLQPSDAGISIVRGNPYLISWIDDIPEPVDLELYSIVPFTVGADDADNYGGVWADGDNEGDGFGAWDITTGTDGSGGVATAFIGDPSLSDIVGMDNPSFGILAHGATVDEANFVHADRQLNEPLGIGDALSFNWAFKYATGDLLGNKGIVLYSGGIGGTEEIVINTTGGSIIITINGVPMFNNSGTNAMDLSFELIDETTLRVTGTGRDGVETYSNDFTITAAPDAIRFYIEGQLSTNAIYRVLYFDNFTITSHDMDIATAVVGSTYVWDVPGSLSLLANNYKIIVKDATETITDESDNYFSIVSNQDGAAITVEQPNITGTKLVRGTSTLISWVDNVAGPVDIYLYPGATQLANDVVGSTWVWAIPGGQALASNYYIRVQAANDASIYDNGETFEIVAYPTSGTLEVLQPSLSGIKWLRNSSYLISWTSDFATGPVNIDLYKGGVFHAALASNYEGSTWVWDIPALTYALANDYTIVVSAFGGSVSDESNFAFELADTPGGSIEVLQPNGGEYLYTNQGYFISWIDDVPEPVKIILIDDFNSTTTTLATNVVGSTWVWDVPGGQAQHGQYKIRIESIYSSGIFDESDNYFNISALPLNFSTYPNPVKDKVTVKFDEKLTGEVVVTIGDRMNNQMMQTVADAGSVSELSISTAALPNGVYFLSITSGNSRSVQKLVVQH